jgi:hypothetical protein
MYREGARKQLSVTGFSLYGRGRRREWVFGHFVMKGVEGWQPDGHIGVTAWTVPAMIKGSMR